MRSGGFLGGLIVSAATLAGTGPPRDRHVVIVSLDGFSAAALANPDLPLPNLRRLAREGAVATAMRPVNPTVTWPNHTSIVTGVGPDRHTVLYNGRAVRQGEGKPIRIEPHVAKQDLVRGTTLYDAAHGAGLTTAEVDWVAIERATTITWSFSERPSAEGAVERAMVAVGRLTREDLQRFAKAPITFKDEMWTRAGEYLLTTHRPNLLLLHLLATDSIQHRHGPEDVSATAALALADLSVGRLVEAARGAGILPRATFFIVSDHGFRTYKRSIRPNAALARKGLGGVAWSVSEGGTAMVYATGGGDKARTVAAIQGAVAGLEGVARVLSPADYAAHGYPLLSENDRMADLVLVAAEGYAFSNAAEGEPVGDVPAGSTPGSHGYLRDDPAMQAIFIASGAGVKPGVKLDRIDNLDVAPTAARLLGVELPGVQGRALAEILH